MLLSIKAIIKSIINSHIYFVNKRQLLKITKMQTVTMSICVCKLFTLSGKKKKKPNNIAAHLMCHVIQMARITSAEWYDCARRQHNILQLNL